MPDPTRRADIEYLPADRYLHLERDWRALEQVADASPFSTWAWTSTWLATLPLRLQPHVIRVHDGDRLLALGLLVDTPRRGLRRLLGGHVLNMQQTGETNLDELTVEYAGMLMRRGCEIPAYAALFKRLGQRDLVAHELRIPPGIHGRFVRAALPSRWRMECRQRACYVVDLVEVRDSGKDYLGHLSASTRSGLRQTRRAYERLGEVRLESAADADQALAWLAHMRELHQARWHAEGKRGAFDSAYFDTFHHSLIRNHYASGVPRLSRLSAGDSVVGYYYHLIHQNRVYCYNAGLASGLVDKNDRPGFLIHWLAIEHDLAAGRRNYDFLAGEDAYKHMLGTHARQMEWIQAWRPTSRSTLLRWGARQIRRRAAPAEDAHTQNEGSDLIPLRSPPA